MTIKIGADPEFVMIDSLGAFAANNLGVGSHNKFGADGSGSPAELRPDPSTKPSEVVAHLKRLMHYGHKKFFAARATRWEASPFAGGVPLGGHIHFGSGVIPEDDRLMLARKLDFIVGAPFALGFYKLELNRRRRAGYGAPSQARAQNHGWEYRPLPTWLHHPELAEAVLTIAQAVITHSNVIGGPTTPEFALITQIMTGGEFSSSGVNWELFTRLLHSQHAVLVGRDGSLEKHINVLTGPLRTGRRWSQIYPGSMKKNWGLPEFCMPEPRIGTKKVRCGTIPVEVDDYV